MYGSLAAWRSYASARGNQSPTDASDADVSAALVRASDYIKYRYVVNLLSGYDETLDEVAFATYEAANLELGSVGFFAKTYTEAERKVLTEVKGIKWTVSGGGNGAFSTSPTSTVIDAMFRPYVADVDASQFVMRAVGS